MKLPSFSVEKFLGNASDAFEECSSLAEALHTYGSVIVKDSRIDELENESYLDLMERYFAQPKEEKLNDARAELHYQVGTTPELVEYPRDMSEELTSLTANNLPTPFDGPDKKWRFQWRIGARREYTKFPELLAEPVIPENFPEWKQVMDSWGQKLLDAVFTVSEMLSIGLGLGASTLPELIRFGTHLLSPTGSDLNLYGDKPGTVLAGFHYDISFLTIHGRSRFPGLYLWTSEGERIPCKIPKGCLLVQSGAQLEYLTGGYIKKGYYEIIVSEDTCEMVKRRKRRNDHLWAVHPTMYVHVEPDRVLQPLGEFSHGIQADWYPPIYAGEQVEEELESIRLTRIVGN
ncbi:hypothetical protein GAYE_SCF13G3392 [Galdieria yellowstonensis]|uniref:Isopenicillin N synthase-like Fe(2+) 2OG dioxygenase domain-containing protein n=1 Tax=Galdieria yellowstonensis TaxID=3028027 RepID=A0AAV9IDT5_9RHOD|nr:hypothetical protein GAYE_SCF13G3392 [Galdieria yellowstonensis]